MTILRKDTKTTYVPEVQARAAVTGTPGSPSYSYTTTTTVPTITYTTNSSAPPAPVKAPTATYVPGTPGHPAYYYISPSSVGATTSLGTTTTATYTYKTVTSTTFVPAVAAVAPVAAVVGSPAKLITDFNLGWNAGARSIASFVGNGEYTFTAVGSVTGIVTGLTTKDAGVSYTAIEYGVYLHHSILSIMELGAIKYTTTYVAADVIKVQRRAGVVKYYKNATLLYTSTTPSTGTMFADSSFYSGGDQLTTAAMVATPGGGAAVSFEPLQTRAYRGNYRAGINALRPLTTVATGHTRVGAATSLQRLVGLAANKPYAASTASFAPLRTAIESGLIVPTYAVAQTNLPFLLGAGHGLTGQIGQASPKLSTLRSIGSNRPYGTAYGAMSVLGTSGGEYIPINAYAFLTLSDPFTLDAEATTLEPNSFKGSIGFSLSAFGGAQAALAMPMPTLMATGVGVVVGRSTLTMPSPTLTASGTTGSTGSAALTLTDPWGLIGYSGAVLSVTLVGGFTLLASGTSGVVGGVMAEMPLFELVATGSSGTQNSALLTMPALRPVPSGIAYTIAPGYKLTAIGHAVVAVTYEAYAMNLQVSPDTSLQSQPAGPYEVTHYTNYPFSQIVRYNGSYFGVATDGLYLLEGDTDAGQPIAWSFRTALTDGGSKQLKRVRSVYIGARLIDSVEVTLVVGEQQDLTYSYTTPRGNNAQTYRQTFGKGVRTRYFALEVSDPNGNFIEVDSLDLENEILERAI